MTSNLGLSLGIQSVAIALTSKHQIDKDWKITKILKNNCCIFKGFKVTAFLKFGPSFARMGMELTNCNSEDLKGTTTFLILLETSRLYLFYLLVKIVVAFLMPENLTQRLL